MKDFRQRLQRLGLQRVVVEAVEIAMEGKAVLGPDAANGTDELLRPAIALVMVEPRLADGVELAAKPAADYVDGDAAVRAECIEVPSRRAPTSRRRAEGRRW